MQLKGFVKPFKKLIFSLFFFLHFLASHSPRASFAMSSHQILLFFFSTRSSYFPVFFPLPSCCYYHSIARFKLFTKCYFLFCCLTDCQQTLSDGKNMSQHAKYANRRAPTVTTNLLAIVVSLTLQGTILFHASSTAVVIAQSDRLRVKY